ncbi:hypothetical protein ACWD4K_00590 [Streptomyces gelaticus]
MRVDATRHCTRGAGALRVGGAGNGVVDGTRAGGKRVNGFYGFGIVNTLRAVK